MSERNRRPKRIAALSLLGAVALLCAGCSGELSSYDDHYVPEMPDAKFPIRVAERPVKLTVRVDGGRISPNAATQVRRFASDASQKAMTPVTVSYPAGGRDTRQAAQQAASLLAAAGVPRSRIVLARYEGASNSVTMSFASKVAFTRECGDFSENLRGSQFNGTPPNFGCAVAQNLAASVSNPEDFVQPQPLSPPLSQPQNPALKKYSDGTWTAATSGSGSSN